MALRHPQLCSSNQTTEVYGWYIGTHLIARLWPGGSRKSTETGMDNGICSIPNNLLIAISGTNAYLSLPRVDTEACLANWVILKAMC